MKFIIYEIKKIVSTRYIMYFFAFFLIINGIICYYEISHESYDLPKFYIDEVYEVYKQNPGKLKNEYGTIKSYNDAQTQLFLEQMRKGNYSWEKEALPNLYAPEGYTDIQLLDVIFDKEKYVSSYPAVMEKVVSDAVSNIKEYDSQGITYEEYVYQYQLRVIQVYDTLKNNVKITFENSYGWDAYFFYDTGNIFIFIMLIIIGSLVFIQEKSSGFLSILFVSKNGKLITALSKIVATIIITVIIVLVFTIESWIIIGINNGYSGMNNSIQIFSDFLYTPVNISVGEFFVLGILLKLLTYILFVIIVLAISTIVYNYLFSYLISLGIFGGSYLISVLNTEKINNTLLDLNLISGSSVYPLFERYKALNIFGTLFDFLPSFIIVYLLGILLLTGIILYEFIGNSVSGSKHLPKVNRRNRELSRSSLDKTTKTNHYSTSILVSEFFKTFISSRLFVIIFILFFVKCYLTYMEMNAPQSYGDEIYKEYMSILSGEITEEKRLYIQNEREWINNILSSQSEKQIDYLNGKTTLEEYTDYLADYNYAYSRNSYLTLIEDHALYIDRLHSEKQQAWFIYDTGWKALLFDNFDWTLYAVLILLCTGIFSDEYNNRSSSGGFAQILRTTRFGRRKTFICKYISVISGVILVFIIWNTIDVINIMQKYNLPEANSPIKSIEDFENIKINMTLGNYVICYYIVKLLSVVLLASMISSLSAIIKINSIILTLTVGYTLLPTIISSEEFSYLQNITYTAFMCATPILISNTEGIIFTFINLLLSIHLMLIAKRSWNR